MTRTILCGNLQEKCRTPIPRHLFSASLSSRNAHGHFTKAILRGKLPEKCRTPISGHPFCASLRSRNAHGYFIRVILCEHVQEKCRTLVRPPRENTGLFTLTVRTPSVWPRCLGKKKIAYNCGIEFSVLDAFWLCLEIVLPQPLELNVAGLIV